MLRRMVTLSSLRCTSLIASGILALPLLLHVHLSLLALATLEPQCRAMQLLVLVRSSPHHRLERLPRIAQTWAQEKIESVNIVAVLDDEDREHFNDEWKAHSDDAAAQAIEFDWVAGCGKFALASSQSLNSCCKTAQAILLARRWLTYSNWEWVYIVDDDAYVFLDYLQLVLCVKFDPLVPTVAGFPMCSDTTSGCTGFCGGAGMGFNRQGIEAIVGGRSEDAFLDDFIASCKMCNVHDDLTVATVATSRGLRVGTLWTANHRKMSLEKRQSRAESRLWPPPVLWHYVRDEMSSVHKFRHRAGFANSTLHVGLLGELFE